MSPKLALATLVILFLSTCSPKHQQQIRLATNLWPGYEPLYVAREKGAFDNLNVKLIELRSATQVINSMQDDDINMATLTIDEAIRLAQSGKEIEIIWIFDFSSGGDALISQPGITNIEQLKGKTIGVEQTALGKYFLQRFLSKNNLNASDFTFRYLEVNKHLGSLKTNEVHAAITFEPNVSKLQKLGFNNLFDSTQLPGEIIDVLVVDKSFANENKQLIQQFLKQYYANLKQLKSNFGQYKSLLNMRLGLEPSQIAQAFSSIYIPKPKEQLAIFESLDFPKLLKKYHNIITENGSSSHCKCTQLINTHYLKELSNEN